MIPLKDQNPSKSIPFVNIALILGNISIFLYQYFFYPEGPELMVCTYRGVFYRTGIDSGHEKKAAAMRP